MHPSAEVAGRLSCEGVIDNICLFYVRGIVHESLSDQQHLQLKLGQLGWGKELPPGRTK